jgi:energy-coupling factor transporter transmembrane protein EcfT
VITDSIVDVPVGPPLILYVVAGLAFLAVCGAAMLTRTAAWKRLVAAGTGLVFTILFLWFFAVDKGIDITQKGIHCNLVGTVNVPWPDVRHIYLVPDLETSSYRTVWKLAGFSFQGYKVGWFTLPNGMKAYFAAEAPTNALAVFTDTTVYVLASKQSQALVDAIERIHVVDPSSDELSGQ